MSSGGQLVLYRHLCNRPEIQLEIYGAEPATSTPSLLLRRLMRNLERTRFHQWEQHFWIWQNGRWMDGLLPNRISQDNRTVVLTIAHGDLSATALRFAQRHHLPLVSIFHDWWPDLPPVHPDWRRILEKQFRQLYDESTVALCVSEGMRDALGIHAHAQVLYPVPGSLRPRQTQIREKIVPQLGFKILYFGNLFHYGPMLKSALEILKNHPAVRLEVRGSKPNWPEEFKKEMNQHGLWLEFAPETAFASWAASADAFLVPLSFEPSLRRQMETSFPSKLVECAQFEKPLVVWGPEYCSAIRWARQDNRAVCVTNPNPSVFCQSLETLAASPLQQERYIAASRAAQKEFAPEKLQTQFISALETALTLRPLPSKS